MSWRLFTSLGTQWQVAPMGGATGLRYEVLPVVMDLLDIPSGRRADLFRDLQVMEAAALQTFREKR